MTRKLFTATLGTESNSFSALPTGERNALRLGSKLGIDPVARRVVVVKSMQHFHAAFAPLAAEVLYVAAHGTLMPDFRASLRCESR